MKISDLKEGDLIFTASNSNISAGHIAVCHKPHPKPKNVVIIHATDSPRYFSVCATKINPSSVLSRNNNHYKIVRCANQTLVNEAMFILRTWMSYQVPFDNSKLEVMEKYENTRPMRNVELKLSELKEKFNQKDYSSQLKMLRIHKSLPPFSSKMGSEGFFCSQAIFLAFQIAAYPHVPSALALDHNLVSPTVMLNSLLRDETLFLDLGKLDFEYNKDEIFESNLEREREVAKQSAVMKRAMLFQYYWNMPESMKAMIAGRSRPEANMIRTAIPAYNEILFVKLKSKNLSDIFHVLRSAQKISLKNIIEAIKASNTLGGQFFEGCSTFEMIRLVFNSPSIEETVDNNSREILESVIELGDTESLKHLVENFPALEKIVTTKSGPFELAAQFGHEEMVGYLWKFPEIRDMVPPDELEYILKRTAEFARYTPDTVENIKKICAQSPKPKP